MATPRERLVEWLRDAHAAEEQAQTVLRRTASQIEDHQEFCAGLERHGERSGEQADRLKQCLEDLGEGTSLLKELTGQITAFGQTLSGYVVGDEPVKAVLATATMAHMEVTSYRILAVTAKAAQETDIARTCDILLAEEVDFADWLDQQAPIVTQEYLAREQGAAREMSNAAS
ncbi:DUF892 family protein [Sphingosinicella rhizophila]|uniref:DUF892 family protein n=1 Tax=Sphingosinicella rhizophila TaxID=3050082 RepID=A0ABU3Q6J7_9SPHN|nr:DUF892 family protein [Sphingosinicella sp. GR2756]MDT9598555.1 DUF892 family protein [Sphingosinicella sp. GR2756]